MTRTPKAKPFVSNLEYLVATLDYLQTLARKRIASRQIETERGGMRASRHEQAEREELLGSAASDSAGLQRLLRRLNTEVRHKQDALNRRTQVTLAAGAPELPLEILTRDYGLSEFEKLVLVIILGPDLDSNFSRVMEALSHSHGVEMRTVLDILCDGVEAKIQARRYFIHSGKLLCHGLLNLAHSSDVNSESEFMRMDLELPRRVSSLVLGKYDIDDQVVCFSSVVDPDVDLDQVVLPPGKRQEVLDLLMHRDDYLVCRKEWGFDDILSYGKGTILLFSGPSGTGKTMLAHALAKATTHRLMLVDYRKIRDYGRHSFDENLQRIFHEARLQHAMILFDEADEMFDDRSGNGIMPTILREFEKLDGIAILATNRRQVLDEALDRRILYRLDFEVPPAELREEIWRRHLPSQAPLAADIDLRALAEDFDFTGGYIKNAVLMAVHRAMQRQGEARRITQADLRTGATLQRRNRLEAHTDKLIPRVSLADVVLDGDTRRQVEAVLAAARQRATVFSSWGFGRKMSLGKALSVLFTGSSGVGKTMTAEAIAFELGKPLYPVKLSTVISKYVGETEKNMAAVFAAAKEAQALLFFDEADALFVKRLDEGSHHACYLNQQVDVLLTELEKFDGVVILATNRPESFDPAFERRIRYRIHFPKPNEAARQAIWRTLLPAEAPVATGIDFASLAQDYDFAGGTIRNVLLRAAFEAATDGQVITAAILRRCAAAETPLQPVRQIGFEQGAA